MPKISVIMPDYNGGKYLKEAVQSVLDQTYKDFEFIILDDGSTDDSVEIVENFSDDRIKLVKLGHGGIVSTLNEGLKISKGEYIIRSDADDVSLPERFEKLLVYIEENKQVGICGSWAISIDSEASVIGEMKYPPIQNDKIKKNTLLHNPFIHPSVIFRKEKILVAGGYKNFKHNEDYELWTRVLRKNFGHNIPEFLLKYRIHSNQITKKNNLKMRLIGVYVRFLALIRY
jgi:glycosyltransferase involved in cell wall biosynthesis